MNPSKEKKMEDINTSRLSGPELALLIAMLGTFAGGIGCVYFGQLLIGVLCFLAHGCLALVYISVSQNRMLHAVCCETARANEAEELCARHMHDAKKLDALQEEHERCTRRLAAAEQSLQEQLDTREELEAQLSQAQQKEHANHLLPEHGESTVLNILSVTRGVIQEMEPFCRRSHVQVQLSSNSEDISVKADANYLRILFRNIIDNSVKYMKREGSLVITLSLVGDDLFIVLKDNGAGLPAQETPHIFELNYQGSNRISGNGLGLTQSRAIVEYYGGTIYAKSSTNTGMAIYIQLPASQRAGGGL